MSAATLPFALGVHPAQATVDAENPWPGLESFREQDEPFFRGREAEADELVRRVRREGRCVVLFGQSGLGKSSLLQAGLFPRLRKQLLLPVHIRLTYDEGAPPHREQVLREIAAQAEAHGVEAPPGRPDETLWEFFHRTRNEFWTLDNRPVLPLLVLDQFEEAFTRGCETRDREVRTAAFLEELGDLIEGRPSVEVEARLDGDAQAAAEFAVSRHDYKVMVVVREDFLAELETLTRSVRSLATNRMRLEPLRGMAALQVTAAGGPVLVPPADDPDAPGVGERIIRLVAGETAEGARVPLEELVVDPALLSLFCRELNERRRTLGQDSITADLVAGSSDRILEEFYDRSVRDLDPGVRRFVEDELLTADDRRDSQALVNVLRLPGVTEAAVDTLVERRLVRREERDRRPRIELTHDVLTKVVARSRDRRKAEEEAAEATARERAEAVRLQAEAEARAEQERKQAEELRREAESQRREAEAALRARRVARISAAICLALALAAGVTALYAMGQRNNARAMQRGAASARDSAVASRDTARLARLAADSARRQALKLLATTRAAESAAVAAQDELVTKNAALEDRTRALLAAQESEKEAHLKMEVENEAANHYLRITGLLHAGQVRRNRALQEVFVQRLDSVRVQTERVRAELESLREQGDRRAQVLESVLCGNVAPSQKGDSTQVPADALRELQRRAQRELTARQETFSCTSPGGTPSRRSPPTRNR